MAIFDIRSNLRVSLSLDDVISTNGITIQGIGSIDTAGGALGYALFVYAEAFVGPIDGTHTISFQQSDTGAFAGEETVVPEQNLIGDTMVFDSSSVDFAVKSQGVFGNFRFVRAIVTSTGVGANGITLVGILNQGVEESPDVDDVVGN